MERETEIEKLRRLRCRGDYSPRLFLAAMGRLEWVEEKATDGAPMAGGAELQPWIAKMRWRSSARGCPLCGRHPPAGRARRAGAQ